MKVYAHRRLLTQTALFGGLMLACGPYSAFALTDGDYTYEVDNCAVTITDFNTSYSGALAITNTLGGYPVTGIGANAFYECGGLTSVIIPDSVIRIGDSAFGGCVGLTDIKIGSRVADIGAVAFAGCRNLSRLTFPGSVTNIGSGVINSTGVTAIRLPYGITSISDGMFEHCEQLRSVIIPDSVTSIGRHAFCGCDLRSIVIPAGVTSIGDNAFVNLKLAKVFFKGDAPTLGSNVFESSRVTTTVYYLPGTAGWGVTFGGCKVEPWIVGEQYEYSVDAGQATISRYLGPGGPVTVPWEIMGYPVVGIGAYAFESCTGMVSVTLPAGVTNIGDGAFQDCGNLKSVFCEGDAPAAGADVFASADGVTVYRTKGTSGWGATYAGRPVAPVPFSYSVSDDSVTVTGYTGEGGDVVIPETLEGLPVTDIGYAAFNKCEELTGIMIPAGVTNIGDYAIYACQSLTDVTLPENLISIGACAFEQCVALTRISLPPHVAIIGHGAFRGCDSLVSVTIPSSVSRIESAAFLGCRSLASLTIPSSVTSIGESAFYSCDGLGSLFFEGDAPSLGPAGFGGAGSTTVYYVCGTGGWGASYGGHPTAVWTSTAAFDADGGTSEFASKAYNVYNAYGRLPTAARPAYEFGGWWTGADGTGSPVTDDTTVTALTNHTLRAKWTARVNQPPQIEWRAPSADPGPVSERASVTFSLTAGDGADPDTLSRGMSNIVWYVDGQKVFETSAGAPNSVSSSYTLLTATNTVTGAAYRDIAVTAAAADIQGGRTETAWTLRVFNVPVSQTIRFPALGTRALGDGDFLSGASSSSGLPVELTSSNGGVAAIIDGRIHIVGAGTAVITASQPGNFDYKPAVPVKQMLAVKARLSAEIPAGGGAVSGVGLYQPGAKVMLTARPLSGYTFLRWEDGSQAASRSLVMPNASLAVSAWFGITTNVPPPVIADPGLQRAMVGVPFGMHLDVESESMPNVKVTGLPPGLTYVAATRAISGVPSAPVTDKIVTVTVGNVSGFSVSRNFLMTVDPLPVWAQGDFDGLMSGPVKMSVTSQGRITGSLVYGGATRRFSATCWTKYDSDISYLLAITTLRAGGETLTLFIEAGPRVAPDGSLIGSGQERVIHLTVGEANYDGTYSVRDEGFLFRNVWKDQGMASVLTNLYTGYYTATLPDGGETGSGYLTLTVDKTGNVKTAGKLADGTAVSMSGPLILDDSGALWTCLYATPPSYSGGRLIGSVEFFIPETAGHAVLRVLDGAALGWENLNPLATATCGDGFVRGLGLVGGWYDKTENLYSYYQGKNLFAGTDPGAATPELTVGNTRYGSMCWNPSGIALTPTLKSGVMTGLSASAAGNPVDPDKDGVWDYGAANSVGIKISLTRATGIFKGSFNAWFDYPVKRHVSKNLKFEGALTPVRENPDDGVEGRGFFLWPDKAVIPATSKAYNFNWSYDFLIRSAPEP